MSKIIVGNWKMNPGSLKEARDIFNKISKMAKTYKGIEIVVCPPYPFLIVAEKNRSKIIKLGAQDVFYEGSGAYTGRVSTKMLSSLKTSYAIVGHSEERALGEGNEIINKKILILLKEKIKPILCVGETIRDHNGFYLATVKQQIIECLKGIPKQKMKEIIIAYEPVWAIGDQSQREATRDEFIEMQIFIKKIIADLYGVLTANNISIIYGGSVHPLNAKEFIEAGADGLLVGRDSLDPFKFDEIIKNSK